MKKPSLRVTKWLGDIPVEGSCTSCPQVIFRAISTHHRPSKHEYQETPLTFISLNSTCAARTALRALSRFKLVASGRAALRTPVQELSYWHQVRSGGNLRSRRNSHART